MLSLQSIETLHDDNLPQDWHFHASIGDLGQFLWSQKNSEEKERERERKRAKTKQHQQPPPPNKNKTELCGFFLCFFFHFEYELWVMSFVVVCFLHFEYESDEWLLFLFVHAIVCMCVKTECMKLECLDCLVLLTTKMDHQNLRAVIWFHFTISSLVLLPSPITLSVVSFFCLLVHSAELFPENSSNIFC